MFSSNYLGKHISSYPNYRIGGNRHNHYLRFNLSRALAVELAKEFRKSNPGVTINFTNVTGSGAGITDVTNGTVNIGMSSRPLRESEISNGLSENIVCYDGVAVVVNKSNPLNNITAAQVYNIYAKNTTNWTQINNSYKSSTPIAAYSRESGSGTRSCFEDALSAAGHPIAGNYGSMDGVIPNTGAVQTSVKGNTGAIGYMSLGDMNPNDVKALSFNGVKAHVNNVANGTYGMSRPFVFATKGALNAQNAQTKAFIEWCMGNKTAENIIEKMGFVVKGKMRLDVTAFTLNKTSQKLSVNKTFTLSAKSVTPANAFNKNLSFKSSNTSVATVSSSGVVKGIKAGNATITATTTDGSEISRTCKITVVVPVKSVRFNSSVVTLVKGKETTLKYKINPSNATNKKVSFKSSNKKVATVSKKGVVKAKKAGTTRITITTADGKKKATCNVRVVIPVKSVKLDKTTLTLSLLGAPQQLKAAIRPKNATNKNVIWSSSNNKLVVVTPNGYVCALKKGKARIVVTTVDGKKTSTCAVTIR